MKIIGTWDRICLVCIGILVCGVSPSLTYAQSPTLEELAAHDEILRSRQAVLSSDVNDLKDEVAAATASLYAEIAAQVNALKAEILASFSIAAPAGTIAAYYGSTAPAGWLICDGTPIPQGEDYNTLRALVGANTPDLRGRVILMADPDGAVLSSARPDFGEISGAELYTLALDEMPSHNHHFMVSMAGCPADGFRTSCSYNYWNSWSQVFTLYAKETSSAGENQPHNNMQPYFALNWIIKY